MRCSAVPHPEVIYIPPVNRVFVILYNLVRYSFFQLTGKNHSVYPCNYLSAVCGERDRYSGCGRNAHAERARQA